MAFFIKILSKMSNFFLKLFISKKLFTFPTKQHSYCINIKIKAMKKILHALGILLLTQINLIAQGGPKGSTGDPSEFRIIKTGGGGVIILSNQQNTAYYAELGLTTPRSNPVSVAGQIQYSSGKINGVKLQNIEVPLSLSYNFTPNFSIGAGASYRYLLKATDKGKAITLNNNQAFERGGFNWLVETSIKIPKAPISLQARYTAGSTSGYLASGNNGKLNVGLRYYFGKK